MLPDIGKRRDMLLNAHRVGDQRYPDVAMVVGLEDLTTKRDTSERAQTRVAEEPGDASPGGTPSRRQQPANHRQHIAALEGAHGAI